MGSLERTEGNDSVFTAMMKMPEKLPSDHLWFHKLPRSPKDSPLTEKKRFKRSQYQGWFLQKSDDSDDSDSGSSPKSILKRVTRMSSEEKRVQFDSDTYVQHIDEWGQKTTGTESLCMEPKDRKEFMSRNLTRISSSSSQQASVDKNGVLVGHHQIFTYPTNSKHGQKSQIAHEVHVYFIPDNQTGTRLKMLVKVGTHFLPDDICVKANMSGNKIRVMATKVSETEGNEPFNERFLLPVEVDPYSVEARLDNNGNLTIEAALMTHTRKSDIAKQQAESRNKSL